MARVLLIDEDKSNLEYMRQLLRADGHDSFSAADGVQGIALMHEIHPDLVICEVILPHLGGFAVLETVRAEPTLAQVPIIMYSAAMNEEWRAIGVARGANEMLTKPVPSEQMRAAIRRCLGQAKQ
jgi:DNA-binding response OmpR family regulator